MAIPESNDSRPGSPSQTAASVIGAALETMRLISGLRISLCSYRSRRASSATVPLMHCGLHFRRLQSVRLQHLRVHDLHDAPPPLHPRALPPIASCMPHHRHPARSGLLQRDAVSSSAPSQRCSCYVLSFSPRSSSALGLPLALRFVAVLYPPSALLCGSSSSVCAGQALCRLALLRVRTGPRLTPVPIGRRSGGDTGARQRQRNPVSRRAEPVFGYRLSRAPWQPLRVHLDDLGAAPLLDLSHMVDSPPSA